MKYRIILSLFIIAACGSPKQVQETQSNHFPVTQQKPTVLPPKENFYIFLMAGQSNMAGRGFVQPSDTVISSQVLMLNKDNEWVYAKEPLHYYEPTRTGLDCGLAFAKKLAKLKGKNITIGLVPCAVGGSAIEHWMGDSTYRGVKLYSNLMKKTAIAKETGILQGILWHQGESNAGARSYKNYRQTLETFFTKLRHDLGYPELPIYTGQLASFLSRRTNPMADAVNNDLQTMTQGFKNFYLIPTADFTPLTDSIHFDSKSQRQMGERFAKKVFEKGF
jgi:hypothetical protein